jgi:hypothetical protein
LCVDTTGAVGGMLCARLRLLLVLLLRHYW